MSALRSDRPGLHQAARPDLRRAPELWLVDLDAAAAALVAAERAAPSLAAGERARLRGLAGAGERRRRAGAHIALRLLLQRCLGPAARGRALLRSAGGKPRLAGGAVAFSLSHAGGLALIALVPGDRAVGVDVEARRPLAMSARRRTETVAVGVGLAGAPAGDPAEDAPVLQAWCRLEAFAKARGDGVGSVLSRLGLREAGARTRPPWQIEAAAQRLARSAGLRVSDVALPAGLFGAVAITAASPPPSLHRFPADLAGVRRLARWRATPRGSCRRRR